jgi:hypothetical protein
MMLSKIAKLPNVSILNKEDQRKITGGCGISIYVDGVKTNQGGDLGYTRAQAIKAADDFNASHLATCGPNCGTVAKWCCASCVQI